MKKNKLIYGVGINDVDYVTQVWRLSKDHTDGCGKSLVWQCPDHRDWKHMLERCFSEKFKQKCPTYKDSVCIDDWLRLSAFKEWKATQGDVDHKHLDKDIIVPGNKLYSPDTCAYVGQMTNKFVIACDASRGEYPIGVSWNKRVGKFKVRCRDPFTKDEGYLGYFTDPLEAHEAWRKRKHELAQLVADTEDDVRVIEALKKRYSFEEWYK